MLTSLPLPKELRNIIAGRTAARDAVGCSQAGVYRLDGRGGPLWLKLERAGGGLLQERDALLWLKGRLSVRGPYPLLRFSLLMLRDRWKMQ